jgi:serine/threonine protein kinase
LLNEIRLLRAIDHPGIMRLYEVHETTIAIYLVVELLSGGELFDRMKERRTFTENDCAIMLKRIIEPLLYMHEKGIIHRDIKPENLILRTKTSDYDIVLADFGLATELKPKELIHARCGTPGYCAPEILNSKSGKLDYDSKVDVFSLGCIFYHM